MVRPMLLVNLWAYSAVLFAAGFAIGVAAGTWLERYLTHRWGR